jgi:hypothetical protein
MPLWLPDFIAQITFLPTSEGGRTSSTSSAWYGCPLGIDGQFFDARIDLSALGAISPGQSVVAPIKLLNPELALNHFTVGSTFTMFEGRTIGSGMVIQCPVNA